MDDDESTQPASELPYDAWAEDALRMVAVRALQHVVAQGLPGEHHFYITFRTDFPGVVVPERLRAKYPQEMTIVLQHQFWDLAVAPEQFSIGLSFGGISSILVIPFAAMTGFADPHVRFGLRFAVAMPAAAPAEVVEEVQPEAPQGPAEVVSLDQFRRRKD